MNTLNAQKQRDTEIHNLLQRIKYEQFSNNDYIYFPIFTIIKGKMKYEGNINTDSLLKKLKEKGIITLEGYNPDIKQINEIIKTKAQTDNIIVEGYWVKPIEPQFSKHCQKYEHLIKKYENQNKPFLKKINLKSKKVVFDNDKSMLSIDNIKIELPPFKNEYDFCKEMFNSPINEPIDWSIIYEKITGDLINEKSTKIRTVRDTMYRINNRIKKEINTNDNLFEWKQKTITRKF